MSNFVQLAVNVFLKLRSIRRFSDSPMECTVPDSGIVNLVKIDV